MKKYVVRDNTPINDVLDCIMFKEVPLGYTLVTVVDREETIKALLRNDTIQEEAPGTKHYEVKEIA